MIEIIQMDEAWTGRVAELEKVCFSTPWSEQSIAQELHNPLSLWLLAVEGESLAGYVGSQTVMGETDMMNLAVAPQRRRQGIGRRLVEELTARLARMGSRSLTLEVRASNAPARALYEAMGFAQTGLRRGYYRSPREDGLILRKEWTI